MPMLAGLPLGTHLKSLALEPLLFKLLTKWRRPAMLARMSQPQSLYEIEVKSIDGRSLPMREFQGKVLLVVNVASRCGFTPQYEGLEALYQKYKDRGLMVMGFPCNQFGAQEPGNEAEIQQFCQLNYKVSFPMFSKVEVNGPGAHPLYQFLKTSQKGVLGTEGIKWNFTKFLVDRNGQVVDRIASMTAPSALEKEIEKLL
jgi:glutathione peroxidase